jgi:chemotaxis-related protein WspD
MTPLPVATQDCWNRIGVRGDRSCPELDRVVHCHNCPVFTDAGRRFLNSPSPEGYLEEWTARLATVTRDVDSDLESVLIFRIRDEWLAMSVHVLVEVTPCRAVHRVPHRGGLLAGLVNIRGELALCAYLARLLGIHANGDEAGETGDAGSPSRRFLVARRDADRWVFPVDEVDVVHRVARADLTEPAATLRRAGGRLTRGVFAYGDRSVGLLDEARLFDALRTKLR